MVEKTISYSSTFKEYIFLTKPGIVALVLITTLGGVYIGSMGNVDPVLAFWTLLGTGMAAAGSAVLNMVIDRDLDSRMERTQERPLPRGAVSPRSSAVFGISLIVLSLIVMAVFVNLPALILTFVASFTYVVIYSYFLKRRTPLATEIGGISGSLPPVIGYVAGSGEVDLKAFVLFLILFMWQPPHFWALAIKYKEDYGRAGIPTLPVVRGVQITKVRTLLYTASLLPLSALPSLIGMTGVLYFITAVVSSLLYIAFTLKFLFSRKEEGMKLFFVSIVYLAVLFSMMIIDLVRDV